MDKDLNTLLCLSGVVVQGMSAEDAFKESCESITGPITKTISKHGVLKLYNDLSAADKKVRHRLLSQLAYPVTTCCHHSASGFSPFVVITQHQIGQRAEIIVLSCCSLLPPLHVRD